MLPLKYLLLGAGIAMLLIAATILTYDICLLLAGRRRHSHPHPEAGGLAPEPAPLWRTSAAFVMLAWAPLLISAGFVLAPSGRTNVRVGQTVGPAVGQPKVFSSQPEATDKVFSEN